MYLVNLVLLWWTIVAVSLSANTRSLQLSELVERISEQSDSSMVCFIEGNNSTDDDNFFASFMKKNSNIPVSILTIPCREGDGVGMKKSHLILDNAIVVLRSPKRNRNFFLELNSIIGRLRVRKFIIINSITLEDLQKWFNYFWRRKFSRIFGMVDYVCYAFMPYATNKILQVLPDSKVLPDALRDLNGLAIRTSLQRDIPRSFPYLNQHGQRSVGGSYGQVFVNFLRRHNATFKEVVISNSTRLSIPSVINATTNNRIDISMNVFTPTPGLDYSYPVKYVNWNILVPINGYVNPNEYFIKPFSALTWLFIGIIFVYIILMQVFKDIYVDSSPNLWNSFSQTMLTMLNLSTERPISSNYCFHIQVMFLSFVLGKLYNIYVTSFLTVFIRIKQFETVQDLIDNNVSVMIPNYEWDLISDDDLHPEGFEKIVASVDYPTYINEMNSMRNTSFAYGVGSDRGEFLIGLQTYFARPLFHSTSDGLVYLHLAFLLAPYSPFTDILSAFVIDAMATGLIEKWDSDAIVQAIAAGFDVDKSGEKPQKLPIPLTVFHLAFAWNCLIVGWILSIVVFVGENWKLVLRVLCWKWHI